MNLRRDFLYTLRTLAKSPQVPTLIVITLTLGIVSSTVMFGVLDAALLHPIQAPAINNVVTLWGAWAPLGVNRWQWYGRAPSLEFASVVSSGGANLYSPSQHFSTRVAVASVTSDFFRAFGLTPQIGRDFAESQSPSAEREAILGYDLWRTRFHGTSVSGTKIEVNNVPVTIVGVAPPAFHFPGRTAIWVSDNDRTLVPTLGYDAPSISRERLIARLRARHSIGEAQTETRLLQDRIASQYKLPHGLPVKVKALSTVYTESERQMVLTMFCVSCLLLLVACANAGSLMMTRTLARRKEIAVRIALGGSRMKTLRLLLLESLLLSVIAGLIGVALSIVIDNGIKRTFSHVEPSLLNLRFQPLTVIFALAVLLASTMILIALSASQVSGHSVLEPLKEDGRYSQGTIKSRLRLGLIFLQMCVTFLLIAGELSSFSRLDLLLNQNYGFVPSQMMLANFTLPKGTYDTTEKVIQFQNSLLRTLSKRLGGRAVGIASKAPLLDGGDGFLDVTANGNHSQARIVLFNGNYFQAVHIPVVQKIQASPNEPAIIVNQTFARQMFPGQSALGRPMKIDGEEVPRRIVGIVGDVKMSTTTVQPEAQVYVPYAHPVNSTISQRTMTVVVDAGRDAERPIQAVFKDLAQAMPPGMPLFDIQEGNLLVSNVTWRIRTRTEVLLVLAIITFVITGFGVYSSIAYSAGLRSQEFAVRRALGAPTSNLLLLIVRDGIALTAAAAIVGAILYSLLLKTLGSAVTGMPQLTVATVCATGGILFALMLLSSLPPAWRAVKAVDFSILRN